MVAGSGSIEGGFTGVAFSFITVVVYLAIVYGVYTLEGISVGYYSCFARSGTSTGSKLIYRGTNTSEIRVTGMALGKVGGSVFVATFHNCYTRSFISLVRSYEFVGRGVTNTTSMSIRRTLSSRSGDTGVTGIECV